MSEEAYEGLGWFDYVVLLLVIAGGYYLSELLPHTQWAQIVAILFTYHLYLAWTVFSTGERSLAHSVPTTVLTHLACVALVVAGSMLRIPRGIIMILAFIFPVAGMIKFGLVSIVLFERVWVFSGGKQRQAKSKESRLKPGQIETPPLESTPELYQQWLSFRSNKRADQYKVGETMKEEYAAWLKEQGRIRYLAAQSHVEADPEARKITPVGQSG
jgi:hypothetical protein